VIAADTPPMDRLDAIAAKLSELGDHEFAHQRLAEAARQAAQQKA